MAIDLGDYYPGFREFNVEIPKNATFEGNVTLGNADSDTVTVYGACKLYFRDTGIYIQSSANGKLKISADGTGNDDITVSGSVVFDAGLTVKHVSKSANYTATVNDYLIGVDTTGGAVTITLPSAGAIAGKVFVINDEGGNAGTANITIATEGSETIDGSATATISTNYASLKIYSDGTNFFTM